ncbi:MAG: hypothetical protein MJK04_14505 [Psychrosphaera sp.]|nr:hypothetical protein [Psychrosphaera sp.]
MTYPLRRGSASEKWRLCGDDLRNWREIYFRNMVAKGFPFDLWQDLIYKALRRFVVVHFIVVFALFLMGVGLAPQKAR